MHAVWNKIGMFNVTEERLVDQNNNILKRNLVSGLELEEIQRNTEDVRNGEVGLESKEDEGWFFGFDQGEQNEFMKEWEAAL